MKRLVSVFAIAVMLLATPAWASYELGCDSELGAAILNECVSHPKQILQEIPDLEDRWGLGVRAPKLVGLGSNWYFGPTVDYDFENEVVSGFGVFTWYGTAIAFGNSGE